MSFFGLPLGVLVAATVIGFYMAASLRIIKEYERGVLFLFGRYVGLKQPGLRFVWVPIYRMTTVDLRIVAVDVPPQDIITLDNVSARVNAVIYYRVLHADKAILQVEDFAFATGQLAQTSLRSIVGSHSLDNLLADRDKLNAQLQTIIDEQSDAWGIKVTSVEIKHVDLPQEMQRVMARQAEAERDRRARIISAEAEFQAAQKLKEAALVFAEHPITLQLRYLQTLTQMSGSNHTVVALPIPLEYLKAFAKPSGSTDS